MRSWARSAMFLSMRCFLAPCFQSLPIPRHAHRRRVLTHEMPLHTCWEPGAGWNCDAVRCTPDRNSWQICPCFHCCVLWGSSLLFVSWRAAGVRCMQLLVAGVKDLYVGLIVFGTTERNVILSVQRTNKKVRFFDQEVDKHWLCGCSPHILFKNSRSDLGERHIQHTTDFVYTYFFCKQILSVSLDLSAYPCALISRVYLSVYRELGARCGRAREGGVGCNDAGEKG